MFLPTWIILILYIFALNWKPKWLSRGRHTSSKTSLKTSQILNPYHVKLSLTNSNNPTNREVSHSDQEWQALRVSSCSKSCKNMQFLWFKSKDRNWRFFSPIKHPSSGSRETVMILYRKNLYLSRLIVLYWLENWRCPAPLQQMKSWILILFLSALFGEYLVG